MPNLAAALFTAALLVLAVGCAGEVATLPPTEAPTPVPATATPEPTATQPPTPTPTVPATAKPTHTPEPTPTRIRRPTPTFTPAQARQPTPTVPAPVVQVIYAIPSDRQHDTRYETALNGAILHVQDWYAGQLDGQTFAIDNPVPLVCDVGNPARYYEGEGGWDRVIEAVQHCAAVQHWSAEYVWVVYIDVEFDCDGGGELGRGAAGITIIHGGDFKGLLNPANFSLCPGYPPRGTYGWIGGLAHVLGLAFGLDHPPGCDEGLGHCDYDALMWMGFYYDYPETYFTDEDVAILKASPFIKLTAIQPRRPTPTSTPTPTPTPDPVVQVIYAIPSDRQHDTRYETALNGAILHVQDWYAGQLDGQTFAIDNPAPLVCDVGNPARYYGGEGGWDRVIEAVQHCAAVQHWSDQYVWSIYIDAEPDCDGGGELGQGAIGVNIGHAGDLKGFLDSNNFPLCPGTSPLGTYGSIGAMAHELGHAFGLDHPPGCDEGLNHCDYDALMWLGWAYDYPATYFTAEDIAILKASPFIK